MAADLDNYLNEAIELELNVSDLYLLFYNLFPMDSNFWWNLTIEEKNHAALLKNLKDLYHVCHEFPEEIFSANIEESAGEAHFQAFTESNELPDPFEVFRQLNMDDRNHAKRIQNYMLQNAI